MGFAKSLVASLALASSVSAQIEPLVMKGTKFFYRNGTQFFIKGIAYQQDTGAGGTTTGTTYVDPLRDATLCARDIPIMAALGTNMIRTYAIDPTADHTECMSMLAAAGIYVVSDLSEPVLSINRDTPAWTTDLFARYRAVVDEMGKFDNTMGFFCGNEVSNSANNTQASAFVKAACRDTKKYIASKGGRWMGVGYAANDDADIRQEIAHYFNCGDQADAIDYWGYNIYSWCGQNTLQGSGYQGQLEFFSNYSVPVFFAEYGCNQVVGGAAGRIWQETTALYSQPMTDVFSGGIVYMYFQEANDYGLVSVQGGQANTNEGYDHLSTVIESVRPSSTAMAAYNPTNSPAACPELSNTWQASANLPPTPDESVCECMYATLSCVPSSRLSVQSYGELFGNVCGLNNGAACAGIKADAINGIYGAYSMCNATQQLGYALDAYYQSQNSAQGACGWDGQATLVQPQGVQGDCAAKLSSASASNSFAATATGSAPGESSNAAAGGRMPGGGNWGAGDALVGLYVLGAMAVGAGMVML